MEEGQHVTKELFEACVADLRREISGVKTTVTDSEQTLMAGQQLINAKVDRINGRVAQLDRWQIEHDGIQKGRTQVSEGIRNWIILGFGLTSAFQAGIGIAIYLAAK